MTRRGRPDMTGSAWCAECKVEAVHERGPGSPLVILHDARCPDGLPGGHEHSWVEQYAYREWGEARETVVYRCACRAQRRERCIRKVPAGVRGHERRPGRR